MSKMPRTTSKSRTPTVTKSNRIVRLLKKKKSGTKSKSSKRNDYMEDRPSPIIAHRKSAPFIISKHKHVPQHNLMDPSCSGSSASEREDSQTHKSYYSHASLPQLRHSASVLTNMDKLHPNHRSTNTITRTVPPPPPSHKGKSAGHHSAYDRNININIDINKLRSNTLRSRSRTAKDEPMSPRTPMTPQSPAERFISHIPDHSIESKVNMKQLLFEMIDMKRQIKSLKKDMKHLKTENDLCHRRISFLEQVLENQNAHTYTTYEQQTEPQQHRQNNYVESNDRNEMEYNSDADDMERRLKELSSRLAKANVFSSEYRELEHELNTLIQQQDETPGEGSTARAYNYDETDESKHTEYNDGTVITREETEATAGNEKHKQSCLMNRYHHSESDRDDTDEKEKEDVKVVRYESGPLQKVRSSYTLSRRRTRQSVSKKRYEKNKDDTDGDGYGNHQRKYSRKKGNVNDRMEIVD